MILQKELMAQEAFIMNPCNTVTVGTVNKTVYTSDQTTQQLGDASFNIVTVISAVAGTTNTWRVTVTVSGPLRNARVVTDNLIVARQEYFRFGCT
jgi:Flp pilus assembly protein TadG